MKKNIITLVRVSGNDTYVSRSFEKIDDEAIATIRGCIEEDNETSFTKEEIEECYAPSFATLKEDYAKIGTEPTTDFEREGQCIWEYNDGVEIISYVLHISILETAEAVTAPTWKKPRFTAADILKGALYEEKPWLKDINDSMELDSDLVDLAYLKNTILTRSGMKITVDAAVRVVGDVRVRFKGQWYRSASSMPKELIQCYHDGSDPAMIDPDYYVDNNNWFEQFVRITDEDGLVIYEDSFVVDDVSGMKEGLADSLTECLNDDEVCIGALFVEGDTVRWDDPDGSLSEQMTAEELEEYRNREFLILEKRDEDCTIDDDFSEIQVLYSELRILTVD